MRGRRWRRRRQKRDQGREELQPWMKRRGFRWECHTDIGTVVVIGHHSARMDIGMPVYDDGIRANIGFLVDTVKARGGTASWGTRRGAVIRCLTLRRQVVTTARQRRGRSRGIRTVNDAWRHARNQRRIATPPDCTCTKANDNITADRATDSRQACKRVSLLTRMRDVNGAADETISCWSRANRIGTNVVSGAMYRQTSAYGWSVCNGKSNRIPIMILERQYWANQKNKEFWKHENKIINKEAKKIIKRSSNPLDVT